MHAIDPQVPASRQVMELARRRGRVTETGRPDLSGLVLAGDERLTYLVARQRTVTQATTEQRRSGRRSWRPYREGTTLVLSAFGQREVESHVVERAVDAIDLDVLEPGGGCCDWMAFEGSTADGTDGLAELLAFLDGDESGSFSHVGWLDEHDGAGGERGLPAEPGAAEDDGGLSALRAVRADARDARGAEALGVARAHVQRTAARAQAHHEPIDAAIRAQDERCGKAVRAFLAAAQGLGDADGHAIWAVEGTMNPGAEIQHAYLERIVVRSDGRVVFAGGGRRPPAPREPPRARIGHPSLQPRVELGGTSAGTFYDHRFSLDRGHGALPGQLPFYAVPSAHAPSGVEVRSLRAFSEAELDDVPRLVEQTSDWFVRRLAQYLDDHGR